MKYVPFGLMLLLIFPGVSTIAFSSALESPYRFANGPFICSTAHDSPLEPPKESLHPSEVDIIHPQPGQFADYYMQFHVSPGGNGWWNTSYNEYVQPHIINTTQTTKQPDLSGSYWCTVDTTNRLVTDTSPDFWWNQTWYIPWIETNVTVGSLLSQSLEAKYYTL